MKECEGNQHYGVTGDKTCRCGLQLLNDGPGGKEQWYLEVKPKDKWDEDN